MNTVEQTSQCFMCQEYKPHGCLECRTHRLLSDIRSGLYDKMGTEQNRTEWEERALKAEQQRDTALQDLAKEKLQHETAGIEFSKLNKELLQENAELKRQLKEKEDKQYEVCLSHECVCCNLNAFRNYSDKQEEKG